MPNTLPGTYSEFISTSFDEDVFIPIDLEWRKKYYKRVWKKRMWAFFLDVIINYILIIVFGIIFLILIFIVFGVNDEFDEFGEFGETFFFILAYGVVPVLNSILESSKWRGGFGKKIMRIEITDNFGKSISFWRSIWRNILKGITFYICFTIIGYFIQRHYYLKIGKFIHDNWSKTTIGERLSRKPVLNNIK